MLGLRCLVDPHRQVEKMEQEEAELLERLHRSQERHRMAYMQLEDVLRQGNSGSNLSHSFPFDEAYSDISSHRATPSPVHQAELMPPERPRLPAPGAKPPLPRAPPGARPSSASRVRMTPQAASAVPALPPATQTAAVDPSRQRMVAVVDAVDSVDRLRQKHSASAMSNTSTAVGESGLEGGCDASGPSTPSSAPQIRYTTVDGVQLDIPAEEDLDLAALLNGR